MIRYSHSMECLSSAAQYFTAQRINDEDCWEEFLRLNCTNLKADPTVEMLRNNLLRSGGYELVKVGREEE